MDNKLCGSLNPKNKSLGDECYTRIEDVEKCLSLYDLSDKVVYCPCDSEDSSFVKYFKETNNCKELIYTSDDMFTHEDLFRKADVIVTNPPFSLGTKMFDELIIPNNKDFIIIEQDLFFKSLLTRKVPVHVYGRVDHFVNNNEIKKINCKWYTSIRNDKCLKLVNHKYTHNGNYKLNYVNGKAYKFFRYSDVPLDYKGEALLCECFDDTHLLEYPNLEIKGRISNLVTDEDGRITFNRLLANFK